MRKELYQLLLPIAGILFAEFSILYGMELTGLAIYIINLLAITFIVIFGSLSIDGKNILQSLILILTLRMISFSIPQVFTLTLLQYCLIYGIMLLPIYLIIKNQNISFKELGLNFNKLHIYIPYAFLIGTTIAIIEYRAFHTLPLNEIKISEIISIYIVLFLLLAIVEEVIFRSILQTRFEKIFSQNHSILMGGILSGIMNSYGALNQILSINTFGIIFGLIVSYIFHKTRSLPFVVIINGITNVILFGILPGSSLILNAQLSPMIAYTSGEYLTIFLIIILITSCLLACTKYWNEYILNTLKITANPILLLFVLIVVFKIKQII